MQNTIFKDGSITSHINGKKSSSYAEIKPFYSPTLQAPLIDLVYASPQEMEEAIEIANERFITWKKSPPSKRSSILRTIGSLIREKKQLFAETMTLEMGKTLKDGLGEVDYAAGFFDWFAGEAERMYQKEILENSGQKKIRYLTEPVGVAGLITPWNFPLAMPARNFAAALAAGCTIVCKPSPETPLSCLFLTLLCEEAGVPPGVINILIGDEQEIGSALLTSPLIKKLGFTGSTDVGKYLYEHSASTLKKLTLELGGHAPLIVLDDADLPFAVKNALVAKFRNSGSSCVAANRFILQESIADQFIELFAKETKKLVVGDPRDEATDLTNVLHPLSLKKVALQVEDAMAKGAKAVLKGKELYEPTILQNVKKEMRIFHEETFGPAIACITCQNDEEAVAIANDTPYGLASYVFTESLARSERMIRELEYGIIGLNEGLPSSPQTSFGGVKESGFGREGGPTGIHPYLIEKCVVSPVFT